MFFRSLIGYILTIKMIFYNSALWKEKNTALSFYINYDMLCYFSKLKAKEFFEKKKKQNILSSILYIARQNLVIGCVVSVFMDHVIIVSIGSNNDRNNGVRYSIYKTNIYSANLYSIKVHYSFSIGDIIAGEIVKAKINSLSTKKANLGVVLAISNYGKLLESKNDYEMTCNLTNKREYRKVAKLSTW
nr:hypothetical protein 1634Bnrm1_p143 [Cryptomonas sp.]